MTKNVTANNHLKEQNNEFKLNIRCKLSGPKSSSDQTDALRTRQYALRTRQNKKFILNFSSFDKLL